MPELGEYSRHLQGVDTQILQRSSNQGWALLCYNCRTGVKSGIYNRCHACLELLQDVKPGDGQSKHHPLLQGDNGGDIGWRSTDLIPPAPAPVTPLLPAQEVDIAIVANNSPFGPSPVVKRVTRARSSSSDERNHARSSPRRSSTSPYLHSRPQRGRPPNGSRVGPMGFRGVRQRRNVRGYLVEIRPPKWKKTIWLGTYDSDREAAGAYDAGIFYTHKKTKYNFPILAETFPALPPQLRLDNVDDSDEIKTFVQSQAREAARKVNAMSTTPRTDADRRGLIEDTTRASRDNHHPSASSNFAVSSATSGILCAMSSSPCATSSSQNVSVSSATSSTEESAVSDHEIGSLLVDDEWSFLLTPTWDLVCHPWDSLT